MNNGSISRSPRFFDLSAVSDWNSTAAEVRRNMQFIEIKDALLF